MKKLDDLLAGKQENRVAPFLWLHGEDEETLRTYVQRIHETGIGALCCEARPHPDFGGTTWFSDLGVILKECQKLGMGMWLLDDSHFPTGYANGEIERHHPELRKRFLRYHQLTFAGPAAHMSASLTYMLRDADDSVISCCLTRRDDKGLLDPATTIDLTDTIEIFTTPAGIPKGSSSMGIPAPSIRARASFDIPSGVWVLSCVVESYAGGEKQTQGYLNPLVPEATQVLIDTVYQPFFEHFGKEFGHTFRGFFSDEPRLGNYHGAEGSSIGRNPAMDLPWRPGMFEMLAKRLAKTSLGEHLAETTLDGTSLRMLLPLLFVDAKGTASHVLRYAYMDLVSKLYSECFDGLIAAWCHEHGVMHIGHTIEDNNAATRLGYGCGHIFRAMAHADMAGIDVIAEQLMPGLDRGTIASLHRGGWDAEFFTYLLGKLGSSLAKLDPAKHNRCMCELFGAYGWVEGNRLCAWLARALIVRGVNEFVPHAFDPAPFPDDDCPPHFFAHGMNPQYEGFAEVIALLQRLPALLDGESITPVALLLNAEGEWSGSWQLTQEPASKLAQGFIDFDLISCDMLLDAQAVADGLDIRGHSYQALVLPYAEALPASVLKKITELARASVPVIWVDGMPDRTSEGGDTPALRLAGVHTVASGELAGYLRQLGVGDLSLTEQAPFLRSRHVRLTDGDAYYFFNEGTTPIATKVCGAVTGRAVVYDACTNALVFDADPFALCLAAGQDKFVLVPDDPSCISAVTPTAAHGLNVQEIIALTQPRVSFADAFVSVETSGAAQEFNAAQNLDEYVAINDLPGYESFAGWIRYELSSTLTKQQASRPACIRAEGVSEGVHVIINGHDLGLCATSAPLIDVTGTLVAGINTFILICDTTLALRLDDFLSAFVAHTPLGITGGVALELY